MSLSPNTLAAYKSKRNRLRLAIEKGFYEGEELELACKQLAKLNEKIGDGGGEGYRGPGRPRTEVAIPSTNELLPGRMEPNWSPEAIKERAEKKLQEGDDVLKKMREVLDELKEVTKDEEKVG